jgi:hypothetical protein
MSMAMIKILFGLIVTPLLAATAFSGERSLALLNSLRRNHGVAPLKYSVDIESSAQSWADKMTFAHSKSKYGENLAIFTVPQLLDVETYYNKSINSWYAEVSKYRYGYEYTFADLAPIGHFSQLVWSATREVGFGIRASQVGQMMQVLVVAQVDPPGNVISSFTNNVFDVTTKPNLDSKHNPDSNITMVYKGVRMACTIV